MEPVLRQDLGRGPVPYVVPAQDRHSGATLLARVQGHQDAPPHQSHKSAQERRWGGAPVRQLNLAGTGEVLGEGGQEGGGTGQGVGGPSGGIWK